jgi:outer membrane protein assembly factor BamA
MIPALILSLALGAWSSPAPLRPAAGAPRADVIAAIQVHGNQITPDDEMLRLAGIAVGDPFTDRTIEEVRRRLDATGKFKTVEVLKRFASIDDVSQISVVIIVNEGPVRIDIPGMPGAAATVTRRSVWHSLMFMPIVDLEDGYGVTLGVRVAYPGVIGPGSRLSFPMTFGGTKRVGVELDREFSRGPLSRIEFGSAIQRRRNPAYDENDDRKRLWGRVERWAGPVKVGGTVGWQRVSFADLEDDIRSVGADVTLDTRVDPVLPRNAVYVTASAERLFFSAGDALTRTRVDGRAYVGLFGQNVLVVRGLRESAGAPAPPYLRSLLGGWSNLRGFKAGFLTGDTLVAGSVEWRMPLTSPLNIGKFGVSAFADWGTAYDHGQRLADQPA